MKKCLLAAGALLVSMSSWGQLTQANEPALGSYPMYLCDSFVDNYATTTGTGVTWDYTALEAYPGQSRNVNFLDATTTTHAAQFSSSTTAMEVEGLVITYYTSSATERVSQGFVYSEPSFGDVFAKWNVDEEVLLTYPFNVDDTQTDVFDGELSFSLNGLPQNPSSNGVIHSTVDGSGTLKFPDGTDALNVIRFKAVDSAYATIDLLGDIEVIRTQFEYYDLANQNEPIFIHSTVTVQQPGGVGFSQSTSLVLSKYIGTAFASLEDAEVAKVELYPNPANEVVVVNGSFATAEMTVYSQTGSLVLNQSVTKGDKVNVSTLEKGVYLVELVTEGKKTIERLVIQ